jgi:hypothetical protein
MVRDAWSPFWFEFSKLRWGQNQFRQYLLGLLGAAILFLAGRFFWRRRWRGAGTEKAFVGVCFQPGLDSEFFEIERQLAARGWERHQGETLGAWQHRVAQGRSDALALQPILALHDRLRFDPQGLNAEERESLRVQSRAWLEVLQKTETPPAHR